MSMDLQDLYAKKMDYVQRIETLEDEYKERVHALQQEHEAKINEHRTTILSLDRVIGLLKADKMNTYVHEARPVHKPAKSHHKAVTKPHQRLFSKAQQRIMDKSQAGEAKPDKAPKISMKGVPSAKFMTLAEREKIARQNNISMPSIFRATRPSELIGLTQKDALALAIKKTDGRILLKDAAHFLMATGLTQSHEAPAVATAAACIYKLGGRRTEQGTYDLTHLVNNTGTPMLEAGQ